MQDLKTKNMMVGQRGSILLQPYTAAYIIVPKVACTSLKVAFAKLLRIDIGNDPHRASFPRPKTLRAPIGPLFPDLFTFTFVRNPWDRLVSCYRDKIKGDVSGYTHFDVRRGVANCLAHFEIFTAGMSFEEFALAVSLIPDSEADAHFRSQHTFVTNGAMKVAIDFVGRYESLLNDFEFIRLHLGISDLNLPHLQAGSTQVNYRDYYTNKTRNIVAERYKDDIELFGYDFGL